MMGLGRLARMELRLYGGHVLLMVPLAFLLFVLIYPVADQARFFFAPCQGVCGRTTFGPVYTGMLVEAFPAILAALAASYLVSAERDSRLLEFIAARCDGLWRSVGLRLVLALVILLIFLCLWALGVSVVSQIKSPLLLFAYTLAPTLFFAGATLQVSARVRGVGATMAFGVGLWLLVNVAVRIPGSPFKNPALQAWLPFPVYFSVTDAHMLLVNSLVYAGAGIILLLLEMARIRNGTISLDHE